ncbi:phosphodiesterase [Halanaerobium praevalens]|uniref:Phosphoesterase n=1 Tax=Halanaerobium praevalens (strain ATCC 33744 / DSM 2228 / GSL) TaxID=572479 RepID=E3DNH1_HALPG|nr:phosphodiesterase [Halanaerobium praevalens]ADO76509.1 phosphodiesterase, MJ0936 family [Halanaerobium praevalens DSM 2228]
MNFIVISDSHGSLSSWKKAETYFTEADMILHAGDILYHGARNPLPVGYDTKGLVEHLNKIDYNLLAVKGNVDALVDDWVLPYPLPEFSLIEDNGLRIVIYHGYQHQTDAERAEFAKKFGAQMLIYGHTHLPQLKKEAGVILLNPGSIALPKQKSKVPTLAKIKNGQLSILNLNNGQVIKSEKYLKKEK